ncbi:MAG: NADH-quinone oxidoreductase subunit NuoE [Firmicutes bacterium]|nr:NADH-quinone oxidoreductase subunit NuoE [Bacillota bacterium]
MDSIKQIYSKNADGENEINPSAFSMALWKYKGEEGVLIPLLQAAQEQYSYIPESVIHRIAGITGIPASEIYGVVTFYKQFKLSPPGKHIIRVCDGTACHVNGSTTVLNVIKDVLGIENDETTKDRLFTLQTVACLGCCSLAPVMMIDDETYGRLSGSSIKNIIGTYGNQNEVTL